MDNFDKLTKQNNQNPTWWNKPLWGEKSALETIKTTIIRQNIPPADLETYNRLLTQLRPANAILKAMDDIQYQDKDFIFFLKINHQLTSNIGEYEDMDSLIRLFRVALDSSSIFLRIDEIELRYRSISQQKLYNFVYSLLEKDISNEHFITQINQKIDFLEPQIKSEEGKKALFSYGKELEDLAKKDKLGLTLLSLFKTNSSHDFLILRKVAELVTSLTEINLQDLDFLTALVEKNEQLFVKLGTIIKVPESKNVPRVYAVMVQFITLYHKYNEQYIRFKKFIEILLSLEKKYSILMNMRTKYPLIRYKHPENFRQQIPGFIFYEKYQDFIELEKQNKMEKISSTKTTIVQNFNDNITIIQNVNQNID